MTGGLVRLTVDGRYCGDYDPTTVSNLYYIDTGLPVTLQRALNESYGDFAIRRAAAYTLRDDARNIRDTTDPVLIAALTRSIERNGYPMVDGDALDAAQVAA